MSLSISNFFLPFWCLFPQTCSREGKSWSMTSRVIGGILFGKIFQSPYWCQPKRVSFAGNEGGDGATFRGWGRGEPPGAGRVRWEAERPRRLRLRDTQRWRRVRVCLKNNWTGLSSSHPSNRRHYVMWRADAAPHLRGDHFKCPSICQCPASEIPRSLNSRVCEIKLSGGSGPNDKAYGKTTGEGFPLLIKINYQGSRSLQSRQPACHFISQWGDQVSRLSGL